MTLRYSEQARNAGLDARIAAIGPSPTLRVFGADLKAPLAEFKLPHVWVSKATGGVIRKLGVWSGMATLAGEPKAFSISDAKGTAHMAGRIPDDMTVSPTSLDVGHMVDVETFIIEAGNG